MDEIHDYSLAELLCLCKNSTLHVQYLALELIRERFGEEGLKMFLLLQKYKYTTPKEATNLLQNVKSKNIDEQRYQKKYTEEDIKTIVLNCRERQPEDIKLLFARYLSEEK